jgi:hypothetical protein
MTIAVVSHDAGSSELLCTFIRKHYPLASWYIYALPESPMATICKRHGLLFNPIENASEQLEATHPDILLFGTGWQEKCERPYVRYCKEHGIPTVAFLDHWTNYRERFGYPNKLWEENLGDFTAVSDEKAYSLALSFNLPHPLKLPNYYLKALLEEAQKRTIVPSNTLLFLSEPTDAVAQQTYGNPLHWGFTQYTALQDILEHFEQFECENLTIRLHPSEISSQYTSLLGQYPQIPIQIHSAHSVDLTDELLSAKMIIGFDTMALYIAAHLAKPVISYLPSKNRDFYLPLPQTHQLNSLDHFVPELLLPSSLSLEKFGMDFASFIDTLTKAIE